jgi:glutathione synthase/RimK-type ligase-like ATP-grasp enzyme
VILILTQLEDDPPVLRLSRILRERGVEPVVIAPTTLERPSSLVVANDPRGGVRTELRLDAPDPDDTIDLAEVRSAWLWRTWQPHPLLDRFRPLAARRDEWGFFQHQWEAFHRGFSLLLARRGVFCVNPPPWNLAFEEKVCQLAVAAEAGLQIPTTLYTTRLPIARAFDAEQGGSIVYKPFRPYLRMIEGRGDAPSRLQRLLTNRVAAEELVEGTGYLPTPGIFQPYVEKQFELRVVVVGRALFACAIHSQRSERSREDWRRYDLENTPYEPYELPAEVAAAIRRLMDQLGLVFGSIDLIVTPAGEHVFLEVNPNGQFDWVAERTGLPIYEELAALLIAGKVEGATAPAPTADPASAPDSGPSLTRGYPDAA